MDIAGQVTLPALLVALLGPLLVLSVSLSQLEGAVADTLPNAGPTWDETELLFPLLCAQPSPSSTPPSSVHALRPSDITLVSAIGLPHSHRNELLKLLALQSNFNPALIKLLPDQTTVQSPQHRSLSEQAEDLVHSLQANGYNEDWKLLLLFVPVDELCLCPEQASTALTDTVQQVDEVLSKLQSQVKNTLISAAVWVGTSDDVRDARHDRKCHCELSYSNVQLFAQGLQESLERHLQAKQWYSGREDFTVMLQPSPIFMDMLKSRVPPSGQMAENIDHVALGLLRNLLQPMNWQPDMRGNDNRPCPNEVFLRTKRNSDSELLFMTSSPFRDPTWGSDFSCTDLTLSNPAPTSVHRLRPADIKVVASLGDSITAGFGAKSKNVSELRTEYKGVSWNIGGDKTLEEVTTLPNILRKFNPSLHGFSMGVGTNQTGFNMAVTGSEASDIPGQARKLIKALKESKDVDYENDWKIVTLFVGANDLCQYCFDKAKFSPQNYSHHLRESLDILFQVPRMLLNVVEILQITSLRKINSNMQNCSKELCPCMLLPAEDSPELDEMHMINRLYQEESRRLVSGGRYDSREDFAAVIQPFFRNTTIPLNSMQKPDVDFFSVDCFHFSERGHSEMAINLWNNMLEPEGKKQIYNNFTTDRNKLKCPTQNQPYIFTRVNSNPSDPIMAPWQVALLVIFVLLLCVTPCVIQCKRR